MNIIFLIAIFFVSCSSHRPSNDYEMEKLTGLRTMQTYSEWTASGNIEKSIKSAIEDCEKENKTYELVGTDPNYMGTIKYKCLKK